jgi:hypothetical protein
MGNRLTSDPFIYEQNITTIDDMPLLRLWIKVS